MSDVTSPLAVPTSVKERRKALKWSQERLAQEAGISTTAVHNLEAGKNGFTDKTLAALASALGCSPAELLQPVGGQQNAPIRGEAQILATLARIEGLTDKDIDIAAGVIRLALSRAVVSAPAEQSGQFAPANPRRATEPSR